MSVTGGREPARLAPAEEPAVRDPLERAAFREGDEPAARNMAEEQLPAVRQQGKAQLQDLLQNMLWAADRDITVVLD